LIPYPSLKKGKKPGAWWLTPVILATQEAEIRRTEVRSPSKEIVQETLSLKNPLQKSFGGVAQTVGPLPSKREALGSIPTAAKIKQDKLVPQGIS
jgi:hypothetical protein